MIGPGLAAWGSACLHAASWPASSVWLSHGESEQDNAASAQFSQAVAAALRTYRKRLNLSLLGLGLRVGMDKRQVGQVESGKHSIRVWTLRRMAAGLGVSCGQILDMAEGIWQGLRSKGTLGVIYGEEEEEDAGE